MASIVKIETARANGAKSKGPKTEEGKRRSSQNALKHGLTSSKMFVLQNEDAERWNQILDMCIRQFQPATEFEHDLVLEIASARWRLRRLWSAETALIDTEMDKQDKQLCETYEKFDEKVRFATAFKSLTDNSRALAAVTRHEARIRRNLDRALENLANLQNEPKPEAA